LIILRLQTFRRRSPLVVCVIAAESLEPRSNGIVLAISKNVSNSLGSYHPSLRSRHAGFCWSIKFPFPFPPIFLLTASRALLLQICTGTIRNRLVLSQLYFAVNPLFNFTLCSNTLCSMSFVTPVVENRCDVYWLGYIYSTALSYDDSAIFVIIGICNQFCAAGIPDKF